MSGLKPQKSCYGCVELRVWGLGLLVLGQEGCKKLSYSIQQPCFEP